MTEHTQKKHQKLSHEILGLLGATLAIAIFLFEFLSLTAQTIIDNYCYTNDLVLTHAQSEGSQLWIFAVSLVTSVLFFVILFLFLLGQKIACIANITKGIQALQDQQMDHIVPFEGNNELTQLAENINYLSATQKELKVKEMELNEEKEQLIRTLSHDIRTPLTSIMSYSEFLSNQENVSPQEMKSYLELIQKKAHQIKELTDILLDGGRRNLELFDDAHLLFEQLLFEAKEALEEDFHFETDFAQCPHFTGRFDVQELRRIFDNLVSNIQKYADSEKPVTMKVFLNGQQLIIHQSNAKRTDVVAPESYQIGLNSIRRIAHNYDGTVDIQQTDEYFQITITFAKLL